MKTIITIILLITNITLFSQTKSGEVIYEGSLNFNYSKKLKSASLKKNKVIEQTIKSIAKDIKPVTYVLKFKNNKSVFKRLEEMSSDLKRNIAVAYGAKGEYYFDKEKEEIINYRDSFGEDFLIHQQVNSNRWKVLNVSKEINDILCYKAETFVKIVNTRGERNIKVIAWFAPSLPMPYGPENFVNLPGLVLELEGVNFKYRATKINFHKNIELPKNKKGKKITQKKYDELSLKLAKEMGFK